MHEINAIFKSGRFLVFFSPEKHNARGKKLAKKL